MDGPIEAETGMPTDDVIDPLAAAEEECDELRVRVALLEEDLHQAASELDRHGAPPATALYARIRGLVHAHARQLEDKPVAAERERDHMRDALALEMIMPTAAQETPLTETQKARYERRMKTQYETIQSLQAQIAQISPTHPSASVAPVAAPVSGFRKLPPERKSVTRKIPLPMVFEPCEFCGKAQPSTIVDLYATAGMYEDGLPGEVFMKVSKQGSMLSGLMDAFAVMMSLGLKQGVPVEKIVRKLSNMKFPPSGFTGQEDIPHVESPVDAVAKWLALRFLPKEPTP